MGPLSGFSTDKKQTRAELLRLLSKRLIRLRFHLETVSPSRAINVNHGLLNLVYYLLNTRRHLIHYLMERNVQVTYCYIPPLVVLLIDVGLRQGDMEIVKSKKLAR